MKRATRGGRVDGSHRIAAAALRLAAGFAVVAVIWSVFVFVNGGSRWAPFHAFLVGTVLLAISGVAQMFTITWSASQAPPAWVAKAQRWAIALGAALVLVGVPAGLGWLVLVGGVSLLAGLATLGASLVAVIRRSLLRRFDLSSRFYLLALACGAVGIVLGVVMGTELGGGTTLRVVHSRINLVGLVGFTILGSLPTLLPTLAHHGAVSGREAIVSFRASVVAGVLFVGGLWLGPRMVGIGVLLAGGALAAILTGIVVRLGRDAVRAGLPYLQVTAGAYWLVVWTGFDGAGLALGSASPPFTPWIQAAVTMGVGQVMAGALAYLLPVLAGPPPRLGHNLNVMSSHGWIPLGLANIAGVALLAGWQTGAAVAAGLWLLDFVGRLARLQWRARDE